jgi:hypothetical protein
MKKTQYKFSKNYYKKIIYKEKIKMNLLKKKIGFRWKSKEIFF